MPRATFTGVLRGQALAEAYANMDLFLFPSHTDTFGNVVLEAMASGVPAVVTPDGGPCHLVREGATGRITGDDGFTAAVLEAIADAGAHAAMSRAARAHALGASWDAVFEGVYAGYGLAISRPLPSLGRLAPLGFRAGTLVPRCGSKRKERPPGRFALPCSVLVPKRGLEPPHPCEYMDLNHARLPIPPLRHSSIRPRTAICH